jgi:acyl-CoA thioester hydrolase
MNEHTVQIRVRYEETDQMGVVYYANYLVWFEIARTEYFRARGIEYRKIEDEQKLYIPVIEASCRYRSPLKYDDLVTIVSKVTDMGNSRITFEYEVRKDARVAATGMTKHAFVNSKGRPVPLPPNVKKALRD